jgi:hypothetical protein
MDKTKAKMAAMTMVRGDHFFLRRWVDYYGRHLGREHLYVLNHGNDPEIAKIAEGANVIHLPYDETRYSFNQRRWQMMSAFTTGFTRYYNWVLCGDVDEIVGVDPDVSDNLLDYMMRFGEGRAPRVITPFAIELVHNPALEPEPLDPARNILDVRRIFRLNANYAKPCITRNKIVFGPGGHFASEKEGFLDPHLYLFHLRFVDYAMTEARLAVRREQRHIQSGALEESDRKPTGWDQAWDQYLALSKRAPLAETVDFPEFRAEMVEGRHPKEGGAYWMMGGGRSSEVYRLPERFARLF